MRRRMSYGGNGFAAGLALGLVGVIIALAAWIHGLSAPPPIGASRDTETPPPPEPSPQHILVLGVDERADDFGRSDTIMLVRMEPATGMLRVLAIPRDTMVQIPGHGTDKANSAYAYGGPALAIETIEGLTDLEVDYYVKVNLEGFRHLVDLMGGVDYTVEKRMYYEDPYDDLVIDLRPGLQLLDGRKAEQYIRFRHDDIGDDIGRVERQQAFLKAVFQQAMSVKNLPRIPSMMYNGLKYVETNIPLTELARLLTIFLAAPDRHAEQVVLPGTGEYVNDISYYLPDEEEFRRLLQSWN